MTFSKFVLESERSICPRDHTATYENGEVNCGFHNVEDDDGSEEKCLICSVVIGWLERRE